MARKLLLYYLLMGGIFLCSAAPVGAQVSYGDVAPGHWAWPYVQRLAGLGLLEPFDDQEFQGEQYVTRYEYVQSLNTLVDYFESHSGRVSALVELNRYALEFSEELAEIRQSVASLAAQGQLHQILLQELEIQAAELAKQSQSLQSTSANSDFQQVQQRLAQLESSVTKLQQDLEAKNEQVNRLYIVMALLAATSILK